MKKSAVVLWALAALAGMPSLAQQSLPLTTVIPVDKQVKIGKLPNGLTYYIRKNQKPESKVELRLVVNAGSILEDDDQQGLAHFTEHMAFNGSENFKKNELVSFLQSIGVEFGADLNAYTSFDETVYILPIPLSDPKNLEKGFTVLRDWAGGLDFENAEIDAERGIILEESRLGKGAEDRMFRKLYPVQYEGSRYASRLPIGKEALLKTFKYDAIKRFYRDWYRPNLMAVVAVGDIDPAQIEKMIVQKFSSLKNPPNPRPRLAAPLKTRTANRAMVVTDKEATNTQIEINFPTRKDENGQTLRDFRDDEVESLFTTLLNQRLQELTQSSKPPFLYAYGYFGSYARGYKGFTAATVATTPGADTAMAALMQEILRAKKFGFTEAELERAKKSILSRTERSFKNKDKTESGQLVDEYVRHFLEKEVIPGIEAEYQYQQQLLPSISLAEVNAVATKIDLNAPVFVSIQAPEKSDSPLPNEAKLLAGVRTAATRPVTQYKETALATSLLAAEPVAGTIVAQKTDDKLGATVLTLSNGLTVVVKPTDFQNDNIVLNFARKGGTNRYGVADKYSAQYAAQAVGQMGYGNFNPVDMRKFMQGKIASAQPQIRTITSSIQGSSSVKDFETMLQNVYAVATQPRMDTGLFNGWKSKQIGALKFMMANPQAAFIDTLYKFLYGNNPLAERGVPRAADFEAIDIKRAREIYTRELANAAGAYVFITGNIDLETAKPLLAKYLGGLPSNVADTVGFVDNNVRMLPGVRNLQFSKGKEQKSLILNIYHGDANYSADEAMRAEMLNELLNIKLIEDLRERIGGIYGGGIGGNVEQYPYPHYTFYMQLPCGPDNVQKLQTAVELALDTLKSMGPKNEDLNKVKQTRLEQHKVQLKQNAYWNTVLMNVYLMNEKPEDYLRWDERVNNVTTADLKTAANTYFNGKNVTKAVLLPESGGK